MQRKLQQERISRRRRRRSWGRKTRLCSVLVVLVNPGQRSCRSSAECVSRAHLEPRSAPRSLSLTPPLSLSLLLSLPSTHARTHARTPAAASPPDKLLLAATAASLENAQIAFDWRRRLSRNKHFEDDLFPLKTRLFRCI